MVSILSVSEVRAHADDWLPVAGNLLDRNLTATPLSQAWSLDATYTWTDKGWLYPAVVLDLFNREIVCWSIKLRMTADIVLDALTMAWLRRRPAPGLIHHSDRGSQLQTGGNSLKGLKTLSPGRRKSLSFPVAIVMP